MARKCAHLFVRVPRHQIACSGERRIVVIPIQKNRSFLRFLVTVWGNLTYLARGGIGARPRREAQAPDAARPTHNTHKEQTTKEVVQY